MVMINFRGRRRLGFKPMDRKGSSVVNLCFNWLQSMRIFLAPMISMDIFSRLVVPLKIIVSSLPNLKIIGSLDPFFHMTITLTKLIMSKRRPEGLGFLLRLFNPAMIRSQ